MSTRILTAYLIGPSEIEFPGDAVVLGVGTRKTNVEGRIVEEAVLYAAAPDKSKNHVSRLIHYVPVGAEVTDAALGADFKGTVNVGGIDHAVFVEPLEHAISRRPLGSR